MSDPVLDAMNAMAAERGEARADLEATGLVKVYGDRTVVNGMDVRCSCGEIVGILGPNGAGKTTTFYMVVGLVKPEAGRVVFRGEPPRIPARAARARLPRAGAVGLPQALGVGQRDGDPRDAADVPQGARGAGEGASGAV